MNPGLLYCILNTVGCDRKSVLVDKRDFEPACLVNLILTTDQPYFYAVFACTGPLSRSVECGSYLAVSTGTGAPKNIQRPLVDQIAGVIWQIDGAAAQRNKRDIRHNRILFTPRA